jgi:hypothetical protein
MMNIIKNQFKHRLLSAVYCLTSILPITYGADSSPNLAVDSNTPQRGSAASPLMGVETTPGQRTAQLQAEVFLPERFIEVFGEEEFNKLLMTLDSDPSRGHKNFNTLADASIPYDDQRKRVLIRKVGKFMEGYFSTKHQDPVFNALYGRVLDIKTITEDVPYNRINESSLRYFQAKYPGSAVTFSSKMWGDQLGTVVKVQTADDRTYKYYVKTHSKGLKSGHSSAAQLLIPQELMVYKLLEGLGIGCESHLFGRDSKHFYIATLDANTDGEFKEYSKFDRDRADEVTPIWGGLINLSDDAKKNEAEYERIESILSSDPVAQSFIHQMSLLDILARLMKLTDLQTNGDNFGFVSMPLHSHKLKIIDFRLHETPDFSINSEHFRGFLVGNGFFNYYAADKAVCYALRNRPVQYRVSEVKRIFETDLALWESVVETAKNETIAALKMNGLEEASKFMSDLENYSRILMANFQLFKTMLTEWRPD